MMGRDEKQAYHARVENGEPATKTKTLTWTKMNKERMKVGQVRRLALVCSMLYGGSPRQEEHGQD